MKRLITICLVVLMLSATCVSWATITNGGPAVNPPPGAPEWWNNQCIWYAYAWWEADLEPGDYEVSPPADSGHWASNFLENEDFYADVYSYDGEGEYVYINMKNRYERDLKKEIYIYLKGTTESVQGSISQSFYTAEGTFEGFYGGSIGGGLWTYMVSGEIIPQPSYQYLYVNVPGLTSVTDIWVGENCIPEPATISLLGLGVLSLLRRKRSV